MPLLHLIERPGAEPYGVESRQRIGAIASGASHAVVASLIFLVLQFAPAQEAATRRIAFDSTRVIWIPNPAADGGGSTGGGNQSIQPARAAQRIGQQPITLSTTATQPSTDVKNDPPIEPLAITAQPMAHGT